MGHGFIGKTVDNYYFYDLSVPIVNHPRKTAGQVQSLEALPVSYAPQGYEYLFGDQCAWEYEDTPRSGRSTEPFPGPSRVSYYTEPMAQQFNALDFGPSTSQTSPARRTTRQKKAATGSQKQRLSSALIDELAMKYVPQSKPLRKSRAPRRVVKRAPPPPTGRVLRSHARKSREMNKSRKVNKGSKEV